MLIEKVQVNHYTTVGFGNNVPLVVNVIPMNITNFVVHSNNH